MNVYIQQTPEWLELRRKKIGASDAPCIMGVSPWKTPYELWLEKLTGKEQSQTWAMKEGIRKEEEARTEFEKQTGIIVFPKVLISDKYDWMMASLDGIDIEFGLTTTNILEAQLNQRMVNAAQKTIVLADSSKFGKRGFGKICNIEDIDEIITDSGISPHIVKALEEQGVNVRIV